MARNFLTEVTGFDDMEINDCGSTGKKEGKILDFFMSTDFT